VPLYFSGVGGLYEPPCPKPLGFYEPNRLARMEYSSCGGLRVRVDLDER